MLEVTIQYCRDTRCEGSGTSYKSICPVCGGNDFYVTEYNSMGHCFHCNFTTNFSDASTTSYIEKSLDISKVRHEYSLVTSFYSTMLEQQHRIYLESRGIDNDVIMKYGIGYCPEYYNTFYDSPSARDAGLVSGKKITLSDRIVFPYIHGDEVVDIRGRACTGIQPKYKSPFGSSKRRGAVYPYNYTDAHAVAKQYVVITEGEIKTILAHEMGIPTVGLPGINAWREGFVPYSDIKYIVMFDREPKVETQQHVDQAICKLGNHIPDLHVAMLPLERQKVDLDEYILRGKINDVISRIENAIPLNVYKRLRQF